MDEQKKEQGMEAKQSLEYPAATLGFKNSKSLADIDEALRSMSEAAGADGESYRTAHGGIHRFDVGRSKTHPDPLEAWGARIAEAAGCRIKVSGLSDDQTLVQGYLDADNWSLDSMGIAQPYSDGSFDGLRGAEHRPSWMAPAPPPPPRATEPGRDASPPLVHAQGHQSHGDGLGQHDPAHENGPAHDHEHHDKPDRHHERTQAVAPARPLGSARRTSGAALALARALVDCGIDPDELMLALARVGRAQVDEP